MAHFSRISFATNMTRADAPVIQLGRMLEGILLIDETPQARWLGLLGRKRLTPLELDRINLSTWGEMEQPFSFLTKLFDNGWAAKWGESSLAIEQMWARSSILIESRELSDLLPEMPPTITENLDVVWEESANSLSRKLLLERMTLLPTFNAEVVPLRAIPTASRMETDTPEQLAA